MNKLTLSFATVAAAALTVVAAPSHAQDPVSWTATPAVKTAAPGAQTTVKLAAKIEDGWHIYSITQGPGGPLATKISVADGQPIAISGKIKQATNPVTSFDEGFGINVETYEEKAEFAVPITVDKAAKAGAATAQVSVRYQACNATSCLPAKTAKVSVPLTIKAGK